MRFLFLVAFLACILCGQTEVCKDTYPACQVEIDCPKPHWANECKKTCGICQDDVSADDPACFDEKNNLHGNHGPCTDMDCRSRPIDCKKHCGMCDSHLTDACVDTFMLCDMPYSCSLYGKWCKKTCELC